jgi:hypothetical protein
MMVSRHVLPLTRALWGRLAVLWGGRRPPAPRQRCLFGRRSWYRLTYPSP